jgi:hypothetical protein
MFNKIRPIFTRERVANALLGQFQVPGWLFIILAVVIGVPDWNSRYEFWLGVVKSMGGHMSVVASILLWRYFPATLGLVGALFLFVGWNQKYAAQRHPVVPIVGWVCFAICVVAITLTAAYGWHEITLREAYDQGRAGAPRGTPDENYLNRPQRPLFANSNIYNLTPDQIRILIQEIPKLKPLIRAAYFSKAPNDNGAPFTLWLQFQDVFIRSGIPPALITEEPRGPEEEGLMIVVRDPDQMPLAAQKLREAFEIANIRLKPIQAPDGILRPDQDFLIFLGPPPINWN